MPEPPAPAALAVPVLETDRLILRAFRETDLDDYARITGDGRVGRWLGGTQDRAAAWRGMAMFAGHWLLRGYGLWALEEKATGAFLGRAGLWRPEGWPGLEVGWTVDPERWGEGFATEAGRASLAWAFDHLDAEEVISLTLPHNAASRRVMDKLGLRYDRDEHVAGHDQVIYRTPRRELQARA